MIPCHNREITAALMLGFILRLKRHHFHLNGLKLKTETGRILVSNYGARKIAHLNKSKDESNTIWRKQHKSF